MQNDISKLFGIKYPIIQGGMIWCSNWKLASAVSNAGGLGVIGSGSMTPELLLENIIKTKQNTDKPFAVNIPLIYPQSENFIKIIIENGVKIVITSAGNPGTWTKTLQDAGIKVAHVVANSKFAVKSEQAGVDAIIAEGFEAGGHNGREETTTMALIPLIRKMTGKPLVAAGGIACGRSMAAAFALGADGVQIGSRFVVSEESSAHINFKNEILKAKEGDTGLLLKKIVPTRLIFNDFAKKVFENENAGATKEQLSELLGRGRARIGMLEGDIQEGELEIGQVSAGIDKIQTVKEIIDEIISEYRVVSKNLPNL